MTIGGNEIKFTQIINGDKGWRNIAGMMQDVEKAELEEAREQFHASQITDLRNLTSKDVHLKSLGESKVGDATAVGVRVSSKGFRDVDLYFDKDKGLLLKTESKGKDAMSGTEFKAESFYGDYKKVGDLMVPFKTKVLRDGKTYMEMNMLEVTPSEKLDDKDFAEPEKS